MNAGDLFRVIEGVAGDAVPKRGEILIVHGTFTDRPERSCN